MILSFQITEVKSFNAVIDSCSFGELSATTLKPELNNFFRVFMPHINRLLIKNSIPLPGNSADLFELTNLSIEYFDNYFFVGITPIFIQQKITHVL
jgi:hypothetical protein